MNLILILFEQIILAIKQYRSYSADLDLGKFLKQQNPQNRTI